MMDPSMHGVASEADRSALVEARDLTKVFISGDTLVRRLLRQKREVLRAVDGVTVSIERGETLGLVGESGCGKTTLGRCLLRLYEPDGGQVLYGGENILQYDAKTMRQARKKMQMVFQDPYSSLNPRLTVRQVLSEVLLVHRICPRKQVDQRARELLNLVGLPQDALDRLPREFSGGQRQRIGLARALAVEPEFIVADEPVSALDVSVQAQVTNLLMALQEQLHLTMMIIAHDLRFVRCVSDRVAVMYLGRIAEVAAQDVLFERPLHPYTRALLGAVPRIDPTQRPGGAAIKGETPNPVDLPSGCRFHPRCSQAMERCKVEEPELVEVEAGHYVACHIA